MQPFTVTPPPSGRWSDGPTSDRTCTSSTSAEEKGRRSSPPPPHLPGGAAVGIDPSPTLVQVAISFDVDAAEQQPFEPAGRR
ncbi:hypothetical protein ACFLRH_03550 [Actinomycetota bacterium]